MAIKWWIMFPVASSTVPFKDESKAGRARVVMARSVRSNIR